MEGRGKRSWNNVGLGYCVKEIYRECVCVWGGGGGGKMTNDKLGG